jgi:hypothetical protein
MLSRAAGLLVAVVMASFAFGQERSFPLANAGTQQEAEEIAGMVRVLANSGSVYFDSSQKAVIVKGSGEQIALAEWLVSELDKPASAVPDAAPHEYKVSGGDDVVRLFYLNLERPRDFQERATVVRSVADVRDLAVSVSRKVVGVRTTSGKIAMAEWILARLAGMPGATEYRAPSGEDDVMRVYFTSGVQTPMAQQELVTMVRSIGDIQRIFVTDSPRAIVMRSSAVRVALAEWLVGKLDMPAIQETPATQDLTPLEYTFAGPREGGEIQDAVRIYRLVRVESPDRLKEIVTAVRMKAQIQRLFVVREQRALVFRCAAARVPAAEQAIRERLQ